MSDNRSIFDMAVDELLELQKSTKIELRKMFKGVRPFRMEKVSDEDRIADYMKWASNPQMEMELRQSLGDEEVNGIHVNMQKLITGRNPNARR